jgi:glycosyltransferase involved in cell wall biosynthesis
LKILFVSHSSVLEYHQQKLEIMAEKYGLDITLVTPASWPEGGKEISAFTCGHFIKHEIGRTLMYKKRFVHIYLNAKALVRKYDPDIIHLEEEPFVPVTWQFLRAGRSLGKKVLFFTWENIHRKYNPVYNYFERYCLKNMDAAIAGNNEAMEILKAKGFAKPISVIPQYGLNLKDFTPSAGFGSGIKEIVYIGRLTPEKGLDTLIDAAAKIEGVTLNLLGSGDEKYVGGLRARINSLGMDSRVVFHGFMNRDRLSEMLKKMQVLVLPSITTPGWKEQFGRVLIEAFASKIAVIGSDSGEIPFVLDEAGLIFREKDADMLAACIKRLMDDRDLFGTLVEKGYKRVSELYTNEKIAEQIFRVYSALQSEKK